MRLLEKTNLVIGGYQPKMSSNGMESQSAILHKLGQLEDIEEKWHIDLVNRICFFKTLDNQIIQVNIICLDFRDGTIIVETEQKTNIFALKQTEYKTKWALTKEELQ